MLKFEWEDAHTCTHIHTHSHYVPAVDGYILDGVVPVRTFSVGLVSGREPVGGLLDGA